jgi:hypothetical protein
LSDAGAKPERSWPNPSLRSQKNGFKTITDTLITTGIVKALKFSFLLVRDEDFQGRQHALLLLKNQASSMISGI